MTTAYNIRRIREARRLGYAELSRLLADRGRKIAPLGLRRIESGDRRVDADDLIALAMTLNVSPLALLLPREASLLMPSGDEYPAELIWQWGAGERPLAGEPTEHDTAEGRANMYFDYLRESNPAAWAALLAAVPADYEGTK